MKFKGALWAGAFWNFAGVDQNFQRGLGAIRPYGSQAKFVWTNPSVPCFQGNFAWTNDPESLFGKPLTSTLPTSTFVFRSGGFLFRGFVLEWSLVAPSLEGFSVTSHEKGVPRAPFKGIKRVRGAPPGTKNQSGHVKSGL